MKIIISNKSEKPIYAQIEEQIREQIMDGRIEEGTFLPSIRALARDLSVSVITTTRAYTDLEREGFIATVQGKGSVVLSRDNDMMREQYLKRIEESLGEAIVSAKMIGMTQKELADTISILWEEEGN